MPAVPARSSKVELAGLANLLKSAYVEPMREAFGRQAWIPMFTADPWDEAVKWIEQREAARVEWPWPER